VVLGSVTFVSSFKWFVGCEEHERMAWADAQAYKRAHNLIDQIDVECVFPAFVKALRKPFSVVRSSGQEEPGWTLEPDSIDAKFWKAGDQWYLMAEFQLGAGNGVLQMPVPINAFKGKIEGVTDADIAAVLSVLEKGF